MNRMTPTVIKLIIVAMIVFASSLQAVSIHPDLVDKLRTAGALDQFVAKVKQMQELGVGSNPPLKTNFSKRALAAGDTLKIRALVILVEFPDNLADGGLVSGLDAGFFDELLFSRETTQYGSLTDYYLENSYGGMLIEGDVFGWYTMPNDYAYYVHGEAGVGPEPNARTLARDALVAADPYVDLSLYDSNGDNYVDAYFVIHAGPGRETSGSDNHIHSHQWSLVGEYVSGEGTRVKDYSIEPEEGSGMPVTMGVFCHEFGHVLGLPDLYDISYISEGIGRWSLMSGGSWNLGGKSPAHFDGWSKYVLDSLHGVFGRTIDITSNIHDITLDGSISDSIRYRVMLPTGSGKEYFIIENRQKEGFDTFLPGHGLLIYHCDDNLTGSNELDSLGTRHLRIAVEQADGLFQLENNVNGGDSSDPFPGYSGEYTEFSDITLPNTSSYYGATNEIAVWNISENPADNTVTFNVDVTYSRANFNVDLVQFSDQTYGNGDGIFDKGERVEFLFGAENLWKEAEGVSVVVSSSTEGVTFGSDSAFYVSLSHGEHFDNFTAPFDFTISPVINPVNATFTLTISSTSPDTTLQFVYQQFIGGVEILVVDNDFGSHPSRVEREQFYLKTLDSLRIPYDHWDIETDGVPASEQLSYRYIIWFTGDRRADLDYRAPSADAVGFLEQYLDNGGSLFITGQDIAEQLSQTEDSTFLQDYLKVSFDGYVFDWDANGVVGNAVGNNLTLRILGGDGAKNQVSLDGVTPLAGAHAPFLYPNGGNVIAGSTHQRAGGNRVVFFGFGFEGISDSDTTEGFNTRDEAMLAVLDFLAGNTATGIDDQTPDVVIPEAFELRQNYPNPFNPTTVISYSVSPKQAGKALTLNVYNVLGQTVATLVTEAATAGTHSVEFDGSETPSGVYFYRLTIGDFSQTRKMVLLK